MGDAPHEMGGQGIAYPALHGSASRLARTSQRAFVAVIAGQLALFSIAAVFGTFRIVSAQFDLAGLAAAGAFAAAAALRALQAIYRPEHAWYEGRAAAESVKTLAWKYAVAGEPFPKSLLSSEVDRLFLARLKDLLLPMEHLGPPTSGVEMLQITPSMRELRRRPLAERQAVYEAQRLIGQQRWYASRAESNERKTRYWTVVLLVVYLAGAGGGVAKALGAVDVDVLGIAAAMAASLVAWVQARQYASVRHAYSVAAQELAIVRSEMRRRPTEQQWAGMVSEAEEAISREHTLWLARRLGERRAQREPT